MKLPTYAEEYIKMIVKKMRYRRKVRQDVQKELTAHFEDELKNCRTDEDKEKKARQLIAEFGDVDLLAILLRRAKIRCRPLWRTVVARAFQTVGVLILCFFFYIVWFLTGKPAITTNYVTELNKYVRPVPDESLNAEPLYRCAADLDRQEFSDDFLLFLAKNKNAILDPAFPLSIKGFSEKIDKIVTDSDQKDIQQDRQSIRDDISKIFNELTKKKIDELNIEQKNFVKRLIQEREEALELMKLLYVKFEGAGYLGAPQEAGLEVVLDRLNLQLHPGEKVGMVGVNGSGKSTILKLIVGRIDPDIGRVVKQKGLRIGYLAQEATFGGDRTVLEEMHAGVEHLLRLQRAIRQVSGEVIVLFHQKNRHIAALRKCPDNPFDILDDRGLYTLGRFIQDQYFG